MTKNSSAFEIRWFGDGELPGDAADVIARHFDDGRDVLVDRRTDIYFSAAGNPELGIKLRGADADEEEAKVEIKIRTLRDPQPWRAGTACGWAEDWTRAGWSLPGADQPAFTALLERSPGLRRIDLAKDRRQWKFIPRDGAPPAALDPEKRLERACAIEKTRIEVVFDAAKQAEGRRFWSVALEGFDAAGGHQAATLRLGFDQVFGAYAGHRLTSERSLAYPAFLLGL